MKTKAPKERKLFSLAAVLIATALLAAPAAEASRYLPSTLATTQTLPLPSINDIGQVDAEDFWLFAEIDVSLFSVLALLDASELEHINTQNRIRLFDDPASIPRPVELAAISKLASGVLTCGIESNIWETGDLAQDCGSPSFQGLWTDPTTGIAYARNRWYDARNASWLSEDPKGAVDSVNLYAGFAWGPHVNRDPMGSDIITDYNLPPASSARPQPMPAGSGSVNTNRDVIDTAASVGGFTLGLAKRALWSGLSVPLAPYAAISDTASFGLHLSEGDLSGYGDEKLGQLPGIGTYREITKVPSTYETKGPAAGGDQLAEGVFRLGTDVALLKLGGDGLRARWPEIKAKASGAAESIGRWSGVAKSWFKGLWSKNGKSSPIPESYYEPRNIVDMEPARDLTGSTLNASGEVRNASYFWRQLLDRRPEMFSKGNVYKIEELGRSPVVDPIWVKFNKTHASFRREVLHHHHINQGREAVPLPESIHEGWTSVLHQRR